MRTLSQISVFVEDPRKIQEKILLAGKVKGIKRDVLFVSRVSSKDNGMKNLSFDFEVTSDLLGYGKTSDGLQAE